MWSAPSHVIAYVLIVDVAAVALVVGTVRLVPTTHQDLIHFAVLAVGCLIHLEAARGIERLREVAAEGTPYTNLKSMWIFAGLILLPPPYVALLVLLTYLHAWLRVYGTTVLYRKVFSASTMVLASGCAGAVLAAAGPDGYPALPRGPVGAVVLVAAAVLWWLVNYAMVVVAILVSSPTTTPRLALGHLSEQLVVGAALGLGVAIAALIVFDPWLVPVLMLTVLAVHRGLLLHQFERAARTDHKTGLLNASFWHEIAGNELVRCRRMRGNLGLLMIDLDHFKTINDRYGHLAGDHVLRGVADAIRGEVRRDDFVGRFGGEEFVVALPGVGEAELAEVAGRICLRIRTLAVDVDLAADTSRGRGPATASGLTCSVGAALFPDAGATLDELLLAADNALFLAKDSGRNQVRMVGIA